MTQIAEAKKLNEKYEESIREIQALEK